MSFWTENTFEPKRANRFKVAFAYGSGEDSIPYYFVKDITKPTFDIAVKEHIVAGRKFHFPGNVTWNSVKATFVDDVNNTVLGKLVEVIASSNYGEMLAGQPKAFLSSNAPKYISKRLLTTALTTPASSANSVQGSEVRMVVQQLDADGLVVETWSMYNPIVEKLEQDGLDYAKDDLNTYSLTIRYDWASFSNE